MFKIKDRWDHTMNHFHNIRYLELFDRTIYQQWLENGGTLEVVIDG